MKHHEKNSQKNKKENSEKKTISAGNFTLVIEPKKKHKQYNLYIGAVGIEKDKRSNLDEIVHEIKKATKKDKITLFISSPGGSADVGLRLTNVIQEKFYGKIVTVCDYQASSMGSLFFCIGDKRIIHRYSRHMMHNYSTGYHSMKAEDLRTRVDFFDEHLEGFLKEVYVGKGMLTKKEFKKMRKGKEYWFNAEEMIKRNICTHIILEGKEYSAKKGLKKLKNWR